MLASLPKPGNTTIGNTPQQCGLLMENLAFSEGKKRVSPLSSSICDILSGLSILGMGVWGRSVSAGGLGNHYEYRILGEITISNSLTQTQTQLKSHNQFQLLDYCL